MIAVVQFFGSWLRRSPSMRDREPARAGADNVGLREPPIMLAEVIAAASRGDDLAPRQCADASTQEMIQIDESTYCRLVIYHRKEKPEPEIGGVHLPSSHQRGGFRVNSATVRIQVRRSRDSPA